MPSWPEAAPAESSHSSWMRLCTKNRQRATVKLHSACL
jgi:hypothetical protein